jgi:hypothetical protein
MIRSLRGFRRALAYGLFALLDHGCWLLIQVLPGPELLRLVRQRPWRVLGPPLDAGRRELWHGRVIWLLRRRCLRAGWGSSCLSRSLSGRLLLDLIGVANELHLGMGKVADGRRIPHAWLRDPVSGRLLTPGFSPGAGAVLTRV